jgi:hypothetical protein
VCISYRHFRGSLQEDHRRRQLNAFASEVTRVARELGTEGKLGGQAAVKERPVHGDRGN